ncbi:hypothetical protein EJB05_43768, partial [Eragrostis curvula]
MRALSPHWFYKSEKIVPTVIIMDASRMISSMKSDETVHGFGAAVLLRLVGGGQGHENSELDDEKADVSFQELKTSRCPKRIADKSLWGLVFHSHGVLQSEKGKLRERLESREH